MLDTTVLIKTLPVSLINRGMFSQILRSSSSIGANYREATESESRADFIHKLSVCKKEASETLYWLELIDVSGPDRLKEVASLKAESVQLIKIFASSIITAKNNKTIRT